MDTKEMQNVLKPRKVLVVSILSTKNAKKIYTWSRNKEVENMVKVKIPCDVSKLRTSDTKIVLEVDKNILCNFRKYHQMNVSL